MDEIRNQSQHISKPPNLNIRFQLWSIENMLKASAHVSGVIIPGDISDDRKNGVSHNRLITAFALGLPVAATRYQSYLEFDHQFVDIDNQTEFDQSFKYDLTPGQLKAVMDVKKDIIEHLWRVIISDKTVDQYESNLMRRICGLIYFPDKLSGEIKLKLKKNDILR